MHINLVAIHPCPSPQALPLANAFLKSFVRETSVEVSLFDFFIGKSAAENAALLAAAAPRAIGFSLYVWNRDACREIARELRTLLPSALLFAGGPEATADPAGVLGEGILDCVIAGEGETPFATLCERLLANQELSGIPGIIYPGTAHSPPPSPISDLDTIPSPYLNGILDAGSYSGILWQLARGCSFACDFCFDARDNHGVRRFSLERVEAELRHFAASGVSQVFVLDSTFNQDAKRAKHILRLIARIAPAIHFHFEVRSEFIDREMAELFAGITCSLQIGLQSADPLVLKQVGRSFNRADFTKRIGYLNDCGAVFGFDLIYGLPGDTLEGFCSSVDYALSLYPNHLDIFPLAVLPGTRLADQGGKLGLLWQTTPPYTLLSTSSFGSSDLAVAGQIATACDIFFTRGKAVAWFNSVINTLKLKPAQLLKLFGEWLSASKGANAAESDFSDHEIWQMQRIFLKQIFCANNLQRFLPIVLDLVDYHHHYAAALLAPQLQNIRIQKSRTKLADTVFRLAPSTRLAVFHYEIQELLDCGAPDIARMHRHLSATASRAAIYPHDGFVCTESLDSAFYSILERINGTRSTAHVLADLGLTLDDAYDFLLFAQQEGIILQT